MLLMSGMVFFCQIKQCPNVNKMDNLSFMTYNISKECYLYYTFTRVNFVSHISLCYLYMCDI